MPQINALSDVLLVHLRDFPFLAATVPSKTQVALASGRPVLMAVRGDAADIVRSAEAGVEVPPDDPSAMAEAMLRLYRLSNAERNAMGKRGVDFYRREMSLEIAGAQHDRIFRRLAGAGQHETALEASSKANSAGMERSIQRAGP
jgi:glycosyltransferase involved in cell wall biosynthesis